MLIHRVNIINQLEWISDLNYFIIKFQIFFLEFKMKLRFLLIAVSALLLSGCMDTIMAVPSAAANGVGNLVGGIWGAVTSIF